MPANRGARARLRALGTAAFARLAGGYVRLFGRPGLQPVNDALFALALRARGYNNGGDAHSSGEAAFIRLLARQQPKLCIDVGANRGDYSRALLELTGARVIAFEPLPAPYAALSQLAARHPDRLVTVNKGVGDRSTQLDLHYGDENSEVASFATEIEAIDYVRRANTRALRVPVVSLDDYFMDRGWETLAEGLDLLKIDTEGYEANVLAGAATLIARARPKFVQIEFNWHQLFRRQSLWTLAELLPGYAVHRLLPYDHGLRRVDPRRPESNYFDYANFVFVRPDAVPPA